MIRVSLQQWGRGAALSSALGIGAWMCELGKPLGCQDSVTMLPPEAALFLRLLTGDAGGRKLSLLWLAELWQG